MAARRGSRRVGAGPGRRHRAAPGVRERLTGVDGRVAFVRRPDRRHGAVVVHIRVDERDGEARRLELAGLADVADLDLDAAEPVDGPFVLVCGHGRRDTCCARLGRPVFDALAPHLEADRLWQSSHLGGHRFAPNVVVLPAGIQLGRIPRRARRGGGRSRARGKDPARPLPGSRALPPHVQAAEIAVRTSTGCDRVAICASRRRRRPCHLRDAGGGAHRRRRAARRARDLDQLRCGAGADDDLGCHGRARLTRPASLDELPVGVLADDLAVAKRPQIAAADGDSLAVDRRPGQRPLRHAPVAADPVLASP